MHPVCALRANCRGIAALSVSKEMTESLTSDYQTHSLVWRPVANRFLSRVFQGMHVKDNRMYKRVGTETRLEVQGQRAREAELQSRLAATDDAKEGIAAFMEKREAKYADPGR